MTALIATVSSPRSSTETFSSILDGLDVSHQEGTNWAAHCPAHEDTSASLIIGYNAESRKAVFNCRAGCTGDDVVRAMGLTWADLYNIDPGLDDVVTTAPPIKPLGQADLDALAAYLEAASWTAGGPRTAAHDYANRRFGIDLETFERLGLGYDDGTIEGGALILSRGRFHDSSRLIVPMYRFDGTPHYMQGRALEPDAAVRWSGPNNPGDARWGLYGFFESGTGWNEVLITEGPGDALTAVAAGYDAVLVRGAGLATNTGLQDEIAARLQGRRIVVAGDTDDSGQRFTREVSTALAAKGLNVASLAIPPEVSDLTEWRERRGARDFPGVLIGAVKKSRAVVRERPKTRAVTTIGEADIDATTDVDRADLVYQYALDQGMDLAHVEGLGWYIWHGSIWEASSEDRVRWLAHQTGRVVHRHALEALRAASAAEGTDAHESMLSRAKAIMACASSLSSTRGVSALLVVLRASDTVRASLDDFDQQRDALGVANGIVNLRTGDLRPYSKDDRLTRRLDVDYHPDAPAGIWATFLSQVFLDEALDPDPAYVDFMRRLIGYGITGEAREHIFPVLYGEGRNGKSRFIEGLKGALAGITRTTSVSTFEEKTGGGPTPELIPLRWARLVMASESGADRKFDEARIKSITGGDTIMARGMYAISPIEFEPRFLILLATNHRPSFKGQDEGLWRRVKLLPFRAHFAEGSTADDPRLDEKLSTTAAQQEILSWAVRGAVEWYRGGLQVPDSIRKETEDFKVESDRLAEFFGTTLEITGNMKDVVKGSDLWAVYTSWCMDTNEPYPAGRTTFFARVAAEQGVMSFTQSRMRWFKGLRVLTDAEKRSKHEDEARAARGA